MVLLLGCLCVLGAARSGGVAWWAHNDGHVKALRLSYTAPARETPRRVRSPDTKRRRMERLLAFARIYLNPCALTC